MNQQSFVQSDRAMPPARVNYATLDFATPKSTTTPRKSTSRTFKSFSSKSKQVAPRPGSLGSFQSDPTQASFKKMFSRRSSTHSRASSGYQEFVFDSRSVNSGSQASVLSGRQGPLDSFATAAMNAVKRIGACWRCKYLRKSVSETINWG